MSNEQTRLEFICLAKANQAATAASILLWRIPSQFSEKERKLIRDILEHPGVEDKIEKKVLDEYAFVSPRFSMMIEPEKIFSGEYNSNNGKLKEIREYLIKLGNHYLSCREKF